MLLDEVLDSEGFWQNWLEEELYYFFLIDNFRPRSERVLAIPADLAAEPLFSRAGATTAVEGATLMVNGDIETIFGSCLEDAESAYHNRGEDLVARYGTDARTTLFNWWQALGAMEKDLNRQKLFAAAKLTHTVQAKTVECAYNYYGIEAQAITDRWGTVLFSLVFYVLYTIWYGYGIMFVFEGLGFELAAH